MSPSTSHLAAVLVLSVAVSGPACAETIGDDRPVTVTLRVPVGDLDLARPSGADELLRRVRDAARRACGGEPAVGPMVLYERQIFRACADRALARAVAGVDAPMVQERHAQLTEPITLQPARAEP